MVASPFSGTIIFKNGYQLPWTADDVAGHFVLFQDGGASSQLPGTPPTIYEMIDFIVNGTPADTTQAQLYVNSKPQPDLAVYASNAPTVYNRQFQNAHINFYAGRVIAWQQQA